jgi:hypothetical protein
LKIPGIQQEHLIASRTGTFPESTAGILLVIFEVTINKGIFASFKFLDSMSIQAKIHQWYAK